MTHAPRHDYCCNICGRLIEHNGPPPSCTCGSDDWRLVFTAAPSLRTGHASTVDEIMRHNSRIRARVHEEDSDPGTATGRDLLEFITGQ